MESIAPTDVLRLLETVGESIWLRSLVTDEIDITIGIWTALGYPADEVPKTLTEALVLFHPDDAAEVVTEVENYLSGKTPSYRSQARVRASDGEWHWLRIVGGTISRGETGEPVTLGGVLSDITQEIQEQSSRATARARLDQLTQREADVTAGMLQGLTSKEIANALSISARTVETYRARIMDKLDIRSIPGLVRLCAQAEWRRAFPPPTTSTPSPI